MSKILITGGTGFVGGEIVRRAVEEGYDVRCLCRNPEKARSVLPDKAEPVRGNILEPDTLESAMKDVEAVINLVGIIFETGGNTFHNVHVRGVENVIAAAKKSGVKRLIYMSALGTRENARSRYHQSKWGGERLVVESGLEYTIFRPSIIFGKRDKFISLMVKIVKTTPVIPLPGVKGKLQPVSVRDVADCFISSLELSNAVGNTYELGGSDVYSLHQIVDEIARALGKKVYTVEIPTCLMTIPAIIGELLPFPSLITRDQLAMLDEDNTCDISNVQKTFSLTPQSLKGWLTENTAN